MAARLLFDPVLRATDEDGNPISGALLYGYLTGGTTATPLYTSSALTTQHANPVVADADGWFDPIYLSDAITYRFVMKDAGGTTIWDVDPYSQPPATLTTENVQDIVGAMLVDGTNINFTYDDGAGTFTAEADITGAKPIEACVIAITETATAVAAGVKKFSFRAPFAMTVSEARASLDTAQTSGTTLKVDINESGTSILGANKLTFDNGQKSTGTAAQSGITITTLSSISDASIADNAEITIDVDAIGDGTAKGLCVTLIFRRT